VGADLVTRVLVDEDVAPRAVAWLQALIERAVAERGAAHVALCGGSTPAPIYAALAPRLDWSGVHLYFGDERCVPPEHEDSTYRLVREALLDQCTTTVPTVHRMEGEDPDPDAAARRYEALLPERLDVAVQGMGDDGHTASLFPGHPAVQVTDRRVVHVADSPKPPSDRLTLTAPTLEGAREVVVLARGGGKAPAVLLALTGPRDLVACPAQACRAGPWFLDPAAAAALDLETTG